MFFWTSGISDRVLKDSEQSYSLESIIKSMALLVTNAGAIPLYSARKKYDIVAPLYSGNLVPEAGSNQTQDPNAVIFVLNLSIVAMEHFARVSVNRGLSNYREGLDFCKKHLVKGSFTANVHKHSGQLYPPSKKRYESVIDYPLLEAYNTLVFSKVAGLEYVMALFEDTMDRVAGLVKQAGRQEQELNDNYKDWDVECTAAEDAIRQFNRHVSAIHTDCSVVDGFLKSNLQTQTINEITDVRKIQELKLESDGDKVSVRISNENWDQLGVQLGFFGAVFALLQIIGGFIGAKDNFTGAVIVASIQMVVLSSFVVVWGYRFLSWQWPKRFPSLVQAIEYAITHLGIEQKKADQKKTGVVIYDFSALRLKTKCDAHGVQRDIDELVEVKFITSLASNFNTTYGLPLLVRRMTEVNEVTKFGHLRKKYSIWLESEAQPESQSAFVVHVEIDCVSQIWFITDIRMVAFNDSQAIIEAEVKWLIRVISESMIDDGLIKEPEYYESNFRYINWREDNKS